MGVSHTINFLHMQGRGESGVGSGGPQSFPFSVVVLVVILGGFIFNGGEGKGTIVHWNCAAPGNVSEMCLLIIRG